MIISLAKKCCGVSVVLAGVLPEEQEQQGSEALAKSLGADHCVNRREPLQMQLKALGIQSVDFIFDTFSFEELAEEVSAAHNICTCPTRT